MLEFLRFTRTVQASPAQIYPALTNQSLGRDWFCHAAIVEANNCLPLTVHC